MEMAETYILLMSESADTLFGSIQPSIPRGAMSGVIESSFLFWV